MENNFHMLFTNYNEIIENGQTPYLRKKRKDALDILTDSIISADPYRSVKQVFKNNRIEFNDKNFNLSNFENIFIVGFGKASVGMAQAVCDSITITKGIIISNDPNANLKCDRIEVVIGGHPLPNSGSILGTEKIIELIKQCDKNDLLIVLISGGGSALLCKPRISLIEFQNLTNLLLQSGANINEINTIRKHLSYVKGGQLIKLVKCKVISLVISDIINDPLEFIASGPTYPDSTTFSDALNILKKYYLIKKIPLNVLKTIRDGIKGVVSETPKKDDDAFNNVYNFIIANNKTVCISAMDKALSLGYKPSLLTTSLTGEAKYVGDTLIDKAMGYHQKQTVFIAGGETTVTLKGNGRGGRNQELVLGSIKKIADSDIVLVSFATDGIDGKSDAAGAIADGNSFLKAKKKNLNLNQYLEENNSYEFFSKLNDLLITGHTGTNVMDIQLIIS